MVDSKWCGPTVFIFGQKSVFYGLVQKNIPLEGSLIIDNISYTGTFKDNG